MPDEGGPALEAARSALEDAAQLAFSERRFDAATTLILRGFGPEVFNFLAAFHRAEDDQAEVFSLFAEAVWKAGPAYEGRSSVRTWVYSIARRVSCHYRRDQQRREKRFRAFEDHPSLAEVEQHVRTATQPFLRTDRRTKLDQLRASLDDQERALLVLRLEQKLSWNELAEVLADEGSSLSDAGQLRRSAARLRKQFQLLKDRLRRAAVSEGLLDDVAD